MQVRFLPRALLFITLVAVASPASAQQPRGHLFSVGGGTQSESLVARFVELAGGRTLGASGVVLHLLPAGTTFNPATARISLPR